MYNISKVCFEISLHPWENNNKNIFLYILGSPIRIMYTYIYIGYFLKLF